VVIGGLAGFVAALPGRVPPANESARSKAEAARDLLADYRDLAPEDRQDRLTQAIQVLADGAAAVASPPPRAVAPVRPAPPELALAPTPRPKAARQPAAPPPPLKKLSALKGIGPKSAKNYIRLGLRTVRDLVMHLPIRHQAYPPASSIADLFFQAEGSIVGTLERLEMEHLPRNLKRLKATVTDDTGSVTAIWLRHGYGNIGVQPNNPIALSGKLTRMGRQISFDNPEFEPGDRPPLHTRRLVPVYPLTAGLFDKELRGRIHWAVEHFADDMVDPLPAWIRQEHGLMELPDALRSIHFPVKLDDYERARRRFAFEELLTIQTVVLQRRRVWQDGGAPALPRHQEALDALTNSLPFSLTGAQQRVTNEILADIAQPRPMTRLVQGEVGSGKTAVAAMALMNAVANGYQGALMAPTSILAEQHFATLSRLFQAAEPELLSLLGRPLNVGFLTGSVKGKKRETVYEGAAGGQVDILVGTQALIQETLDVARLGVVIVDEQHRFGVKQRVTLRRKTQDGEGTPHLLVMTATPIPRTLALSLYGDLDLSVIDQMPPGRQEVKTVLMGGDERHLAYEHVRRQAAKGRQAFIICPLVEESEVLEAKAATEEYESLKNGELSDLRLGLLHGRMKPAEKDAIMRSFRDREFDVLVSTAVVEVGVDIPNATVMLIEGAERFGLAQLHQFRGRVGRGEHASSCILLTDIPNPKGNDRLRVVERSSNGLELAEHDLRLRGPGDYFGVRQSGFPELKVARLDDAMLVEAARSSANRLLAEDPELERPENQLLKQHLTTFRERIGEPS
jgi:ATP-dependent DNA helicase RecG